MEFQVEIFDIHWISILFTDVNKKVKCRKRTRNPENHKHFQQKSKVQRGQEHKTNSGKTIPTKVFCAQNNCSCKNKCAQKISQPRQEAIFDTFYSLENRQKKVLYLRSLVKCRSKEENLNPVTAKKRNTRDYFLSDDLGHQRKVCVSFFKKCMQISGKVIHNAISTSISNQSAAELRGRFSTRKTSESDEHFVERFIKKLPAQRSHYGLSQSKRKYLNPSLNITRLYREYSIVCPFKKRKILSLWKFREVFNTKFNLAFHAKRVDTCRTCDKLEALIQSERSETKYREQLSKQKHHHLQLVQHLKENFKSTIDDAKDSSSNTEVLVFDLQRVLETPSISTSEAFYRRQLSCYNLCIYDLKRERGFMYFWNETIASRGAQEISSCLIKYFKQFIPQNTKKIIMYSDACPGQNRNIKITVMMKKILDSWPHSTLQSIEQRFFVSGHSFNSCDRCFGVIEKQKRITEMIYVPQHWLNIIEQAKKNEPKFKVIEMVREDFFSCKRIEEIITNRKKSINDEKINWMKIQKIINNRDNPFKLIIERYSSKQSVQRIQVDLKKRGQNWRSITFSSVNFSPLYEKSRPIARKKYDDLLKLTEYIPTKFHAFFKSLEYEDEPMPKRKKK